MSASEFSLGPKAPFSPGPKAPFSYAILRVVPRIERGERFNVGVVVFCRQRGFLGAQVALDAARLAALAPGAVTAELSVQLDGLVRLAAGDPSAGPLAAMDASERFGWLVAPSSTMIQPSEVHTGLSADPAATLARLFEQLVAPVDGSSPRGG